MRYAEFLERGAFEQHELLALSWGTLIDDPPEELVQLPAPPMLMVDRIVSIERDGLGGSVVAERDVRVDDWFFQCHFRGDPVQPGCLGVDAIWQLLGLYCGWRGAIGSGRALGCKEVEFAGQIRPLDTLVRYEIAVRRYVELKAKGSAVVIGNGEVFVDGQRIYRIRDAKVGVFRSIAYRDYPADTKQSHGGILVPEEAGLAASEVGR